MSRNIFVLFIIPTFHNILFSHKCLISPFLLISCSYVRYDRQNELGLFKKCFLFYSADKVEDMPLPTLQQFYYMYYFCNNQEKCKKCFW